jgi:hypothetical protein
VVVMEVVMRGEKKERGGRDSHSEGLEGGEC